MEKINTRIELLERLKDILAVEILAKKGYEEDTITFSNFELKDTLEKIKIDEDEHITLLESMIKILEKK